MLDLDLREYFNLDEPVEIAAFNYTLRHPHQQILMTRRLLNNPLVDEEVKQPFRNFLSKSKIKPEEFPAFQTAIANVYNQYKQRIAVAKESDIIQAQAKYYEKLIDRLDNFITTQGRIPKWNTTNPQELQLFDEIEWVQHHRQDNQFEPLVSYQKTLDLTLEKAKPVYLTRQETLELFEDFVKTTNRLYPRSLRDKPKAGDIPFQREEELWDNLSYWRVEDSSLFQDITKIYEKHLH